MNVSFNIDDHLDLIYVAKQIIAMSEGSISSMSLKDIQTAQSELQMIERTCEEVESKVVEELELELEMA